MTLDEAIACTKEISSREFNDMIHCIRCSEIHGYIADWLEELKGIKEEISTDEWIREHDRLIHNEAIDDFVNAINQISYVPVCVDCLSKQQIRDIAKRLKLNVHSGCQEGSE